MPAHQHDQGHAERPGPAPDRPDLGVTCHL